MDDSEVEREELHARDIQLRGYRRADGLFEVEARLLDRKTYEFRAGGDGPAVPPGQAIHDMGVRVVFDVDLLVHDVQAATRAAPYADCFDAGSSLARMRGVRMTQGWSREVRARLGGAQGCTHLMELLLPLATAAFQTVSQERLARPAPRDAAGRPVKIDSCWAYAGHRAVVAQRWPEYAVATADAEHRHEK